MMVHWHPDNLIYVRTPTGIIFCGTLQVAAALIGKPLDPLPQAVIERQYFPSQYTADFTASGQVEGPSEWADGDALLAAVQE